MTMNSDRPRLLAVFAHPDDETFLAGGTLAKYAAEGFEVFLLCATRGQLGQKGEYNDLNPTEFSLLRQRELESACRALGIHQPLFLDCADQHLGKDCWDSATREIVQAIRRIRPDVVITFGPDGISGHPEPQA